MPTKFTNKSLYEWLKEKVAEHKSDECLIWPFAVTYNGYGRLYVHPTRRVEMAHRVAYQVANGVWPEPCGLHKCDVRTCFNPRHVFPGTDADNVEDRERKDRGAKIKPKLQGEKNCNAKLTGGSVREIRQLRSEGIAFKEIAARFGVSASTIYRIIHGVKWRHEP